MRNRVSQARRWVVKIGSSLVTNNGLGLDRDAIAGWVGQLAAMRRRGMEFVLVSSGAVAEGVSRLALAAPPKQIHIQQAAAAVGQMGLVQAYESCFMAHDVHTAQILLSHEDLSDRTRYLNARASLSTLLEMGVVPVVNENDTVATAELCFGDNDTLAGLVANLVNADIMVVLTDQDGVYSADPRLDPEARLIESASALDERLTGYAGAGSGLGRGGMVTKLSAARLAARSGTSTLIANGKLDRVLLRMADGETVGTLLQADSEPMAARKQWLAGSLSPRGRLVLDAGAVKVLRESGKSLLAVGIRQVEGNFSRGDMVTCVDESGGEIARGLVNYNAAEIQTLKGQSSDGIAGLLGYAGEEEIIHRDNMVLN